MKRKRNNYILKPFDINGIRLVNRDAAVPFPGPELRERLKKIQLLALDVDGTLTDGSIGYTSTGDELKTFCASDGLILAAMIHEGFKVALITGRNSEIVRRRANDLGITRIVQGVRDKATALCTLQSQESVTQEETAYIGDDWNDLPAFTACGIKVAVKGSPTELVAEADVVTRKPGGKGAVREFCELLLSAKDDRERFVQRYLENLRNKPEANNQRQ